MDEWADRESPRSPRRALLRGNYTGVVGIEYEKNMRDLLPGLAECVGYARGVLAAVP